MKVLANDGISETGKRKLEAAGIFVETNKVDQAELINAINSNNYECVLVRSATTVRKEVVDACPGLKMIGRGGVGMDNIDVEYARSKGLKVFNTPASSSQSVAEMVIGQFFSIARGFYDANRVMPGVDGAGFSALKKKHGKGTELRGKTLGIIGFGRIGRSTASYALGCGMNVIAVDLFQNDEPISVVVGGTEVKVQVPYVTMRELLAKSDCISIHVPKQADGSAVLGKEELNSMKTGVLLVNAARGGVIDEQALLEAIAAGKVRAAALDVFENEPTPDPNLLRCEKLALSPHIGAATVEAQDRIGEELADHIIAFAKN